MTKEQQLVDDIERAVRLLIRSGVKVVDGGGRTGSCYVIDGDHVDRTDLVSMRGYLEGYLAAIERQAYLAEPDPAPKVLPEVLFADIPNWELCHLCGGQLDAGSVDVEGEHAFQGVKCSQCGASWTEEYEAVRRAGIEET